MIESLIYGEDATLEILISGTWYPVLCQADLTLSVKQEVILKTGPNSGLFREKTTRFSEASASVSGLTPLENSTVVSAFYMMQESVRLQAQSIRLKYLDKLGGSKQISASAIITGIDMGSPIDDFVNSDISFDFTSAFTIEAVTAPPGAVQLYSDNWTAIAGNNYISGASDIHSYSLIGKTILEVDRDGTQFDFIGNNLTPNNRQCSWDTTLNRLVFLNNFNTGETVFVIFQ